MQAYQENISAKVSGVLSPILGVSVTVTDTATGLPATLYSDNGVTQIAQPLVTDETGYFSFYAANGSYTVKFSSPQIAVGTRKIELYDRDDDAPLTQAQAASPTGASSIGYQPSNGGSSMTVEQALHKLDGGGPIQRAQVVATRGRMPINVEGGGTSNYTRFESGIWVQTGPRPVNSLQVVYCNRTAVGGGEVWTSANDYQLESAIIWGSQAIPVTFSGIKNPLIGQGAPFVVGDKLGLNLPANAKLQLRSAGIVAAGQKAPVGQPSSYQYSGYDSAASASQVYSMSVMATPAGGTSAVYGFVPLAVIGIPDKRHVAALLWGDSITYGTGDTLNGESTYGHVGWAERGLVGAAGSGINVPFVNVSRSGDSTSTWSSNANAYQGTRWALLEYVTHAVFAMGINDIAGGNTLAQMQANVQVAWASAKRMGVKVYQTTLTPKTTSTDSWATLANQTVSAGYGAAEIRGQFNAWLSSQLAAGNIDGIINLNASVCDATNSDKWAVNGTANYMTADGLHPSTPGHINMAAVLNALALTWAV